MQERLIGNNLVSLHNNLLKVWQNQKVDQYYQNIILNYLDNLPQQQAELKIIGQIKACHEGNSQFFLLNQKLNKRKRALQNLEQILKKQGLQENIEEQLPLICQLIDELRDFNLHISEILINLHRTYTGNYREISDQFLQILVNLDRQMEFLKQSILGNYIMFQNGYDPFFLHHYEIRKRKMPFMKSQQVDETFHLNISYAYRLYKAKAKILELLGTGGKMTIGSQGKQMKKKAYHTLGNDEQYQLNHNYFNKNKKTYPQIHSKRHSISLQQAQQNRRLKGSDFNRSFYKNRSLKKPIFNPTYFKQVSPKFFKQHHEQQSSEEQIVVVKKTHKFNRRSNIFMKKDDQFYQLVPVKQTLPQKQDFYESQRSSKFDHLSQSNMFTKKFKEKLKPLNNDNQDSIQMTSSKFTSSTSPVSKKYYNNTLNSIKSPVNLDKPYKKNFNIHKVGLTKYPETLQEESEYGENSSSKYGTIEQYNYEKMPYESNLTQMSPIIKRANSYEHNQQEQNQFLKLHMNQHNPRQIPLKHFQSRQSKQQANSYEIPSHINQNSSVQSKNKQKGKNNFQPPQQIKKQEIKRPLIDNKMIIKQPNNQIKKEKSSIILSQFETKTLQDLNKLKIKMKPGQLSFNQLISYIKSLNLSLDVKNQITHEPKWITSLSASQSYIIQFIINDKISHFSIVHVLPEGDYLIKFWWQMLDINQEINRHVFKKFIQFIQKNTTGNNIHFFGLEITELKIQKFQQKEEKRFIRKRIIAKPEKELQFPQFLSIKCTNICFPQQKQTFSMLYSDQIQSFKQENYYINQNLLEQNKANVNKNLLLMMKISQNIESMSILNQLLQDEDFDTFQVTSKFNISKISAIRLLLHTKIKSPFIAGNGYLKYNTKQSLINDKNVICKLNCFSANVKIVIGKGFDNMNAFMQNCKKTMSQSCTFSVKMFQKQLYGRLVNENRKCFYGNWDVSLSWKDQLQGRLKHEMTQNTYFGPEEFYFGIQFQSELVLAFKVKKQDCLL